MFPRDGLPLSINVLMLSLFLLTPCESWSLVCPSESGQIPRLVPHPTDCRSVLVCAKGSVPRRYYCPPGQVFSPKMLECVKKQGCSKSNLDIDEQTAFVTCPRENGRDVVMFPHPTECGFYYVCDHGLAKLKTCPSGLHYNEHLRTCDWPQRANCKARVLTLQP